MRNQELIRGMIDPYISRHNKVGKLVPIFFDNKEIYNRNNNAHGLFFGEFFLSQGTKVVVRLNGQDFIVSNNDEILFEEIKGLTGIQNAVLDYFSFVTPSDVFETHPFVKIAFDGQTMTVKALDDTVLSTVTITGVGEQTLVDTFTYNIDVQKLPTGQFEVVVDYELKMYQYIPSVAGTEVQKTVNSILPGISIESSEAEIFEFISTDTSYKMSDQLGNLMFLTAKANKTVNFKYGKVTFSEAIPNGTYYIDRQEILYTKTEGQEESKTTVQEKQLLTGIAFSTAPGSNYKMVVVNDRLTIFRYDSGKWVFVVSRDSFLGEENGVTLTRSFPEGTYYFNDQFEVMAVSDAFSGTFSKIPFFDLTYTGAAKYLKIRAIFSEFDYPQLYAQIGETSYSLTKLKKVAGTQSIDLNGENIDLVMNQNLPGDKPGVDDLMQQIFDFQETHGEQIFEFTVIPDGTIINVLKEEITGDVEKEVNKENPYLSVWNIRAGLFSEKYLGVKMTEESETQVRITVFHPVSNEVQDSKVVLKSDRSGIIMDGLVVMLVDTPVFTGGTELVYYFNVLSHTWMYDFIRSGDLIKVAKKFPFGDIEVYSALFKAESFNKLKAVVSKSDAWEIKLYDLADRFIDRVVIITSGMNISEQGLFTINWNYTGAYVAPETWIFDNQDNVYQMTDNGSQVVTENKTFDFITFNWGTYAGQKIVRLLKVGNEVEIYVDETLWGTFSNNGETITNGDASATLQLLSVVTDELYIDGNRNVVYPVGGLTVPAHEKEVWEVTDFRAENIDFTGFVYNVAMIRIYKVSGTGNFMAVLFDVKQSYGLKSVQNFNVSELENNSVTVSFAKLIFPNGLDWATHETLELIVNDEGKVYDLTHEHEVSLVDKSISEVTSENEPYYFSQVAYSGDTYKVRVLDQSGNWYANQTGISEATLRAALPGNYDFDLPTFAEAGGNVLKGIYFQGKRWLVTKKSGSLGVTLASIGWQIHIQPLRDGIFGFSPNGGNVGFAFFAVEVNSDNTYTEFATTSSSTTGYWQDFAGGKIKTLSDNIIVQNNLKGIYYYDNSDGLCYPVELMIPVTDAVAQPQVDNGIEIVPETVVEPGFELETQEVIDFLSDPTFTQMFDVTGTSTSYQFIPIMETITESEIIQAFKYIEKPFKSDLEALLENVYYDREILIPGTADTYEVITTTETVTEGASSEQLLPITVAGSLEIPVSGSMGVNDGSLPGGSYQVVPAFQFQGYFIEFE